VEGDVVSISFEKQMLAALKRVCKEFKMKYRAEGYDNGTFVWTFSNDEDILKVEYTQGADEEALEEVKR
jgi:hypothetical protein